MQKQKGISTLVGVTIIVAIAIIAFGGVFAWKFNNEFYLIPTSVTTNQTAGWKTYKNEGLGYELKYPQDLTLDNTTITELFKTTMPDFVDGFEIKSQNNSENLAHWKLEVYKNKKGPTAVQQRAEEIGGPLYPSEVKNRMNTTITDITVDGINGKKVALSYLRTDNAIEESTLIFIIKGENIYEFYCQGNISGKSVVKNYDSVRFNQMLSTFKFIR